MKYITIICFITLLLTTLLFGQTSNIDTVINNSKQTTKQTDILTTKVNILSKETAKLTSKISEQSTKINHLIEMNEQNRFDYFKDLIYPILLSIIAAVIFWLVFSYFPERSRRRKIRPKLDLDMYNVYTNLFSIFDLVMRPNNHSPSNFQPKIKGNKLEKEDLELGLQNKCWNETYLYDTNVSKNLLVIGKNLFEIASKIDRTVERLFNFSNYLSADEILILEKIRKKLQVYGLSDYNRNAASIIGGMELKPVNPSLSFMSQNLFELYKLFIQFQDLVYSNNYIDRDISISKVQHYFYSGQYEKCKKEISKSIFKYPDDKNFLDFYSFLSEYTSGQKDKSYKMLDTILKSKPHLVSSRGFIDDLLNDDKIKELIQKHYTENEITELRLVLKREEDLQKSYIDQAKALLKYYKDKSDNTKSKNK